MAAAAPYLMLAQAAMSVVGAISSASAQSASMKSQAQAKEANAKILRDNAAQASREANVAEDNLRIRQRIQRGAQVAGIAQSGIGFAGTGGDLLEQTDINQTLDDLGVRYEGEMKARGLKTQADFETYDAQGLRAGAKSTMTSGYMSAFGSAVSGASSYGQYQAKYSSTALPWQQSGNVRPSYLGGGTY